jgi:hypothetical protein
LWIPNLGKGFSSSNSSDGKGGWVIEKIDDQASGLQHVNKSGMPYSFSSPLTDNLDLRNNTFPPGYNLLKKIYVDCSDDERKWSKGQLPLLIER